MSSILIHGGNQEERKRTALELLAEKGIGQGTNLIEIGEEKEKLGINEIKAFLPHLHVRSANGQRGFIIFEAQQLTIAAQNTLLKILEEPPAHLVIVLTTSHPRLLLPTVVSRCLATPLRQSFEGQAETQNKTVEEIFAAQSGQRLALFEEKIGFNREDVFRFLDEIEAHLKKNLSQESAQLLVKLWKAKKLLREETANTKLIVDELLFSW